MIHSNSQGGFAIGAVIGIVAVIALLGGGAYVATQYDASIDAETSTTTDQFRTESDMVIEEEVSTDATTTLETSATIDAGIDAGSSVDAGVGLDVNANINY